MEKIMIMGGVVVVLALGFYWVRAKVCWELRRWRKLMESTSGCSKAGAIVRRSEWLMKVFLIPPERIKCRDGEYLRAIGLGSAEASLKRAQEDLRRIQIDITHGVTANAVESLLGKKEELEKKIRRLERDCQFLSQKR